MVNADTTDSPMGMRNESVSQMKLLIDSPNDVTGKMFGVVNDPFIPK
jgi:hypothetical protein